MGESFFHGLDLIDSLESENLKLNQFLTNAKTSSNYYKGMLDGAEKKIKELNESHKAKLKNLQDELEKVRGDVKSASEAHNKELAKLKAEKESIQQGKDVELSNAFSLGFKAYLENFLAADPDYDWAPHFPPSTPAYMVNFKADNANAIEKAREGLKAKIASELEAKARGDANREQGTEAESEQGTEVERDNETTVASPSQTVGP